MDGLTDYIKWLGRFSFREYPMNDVDALVMCVISYFDLSPALRGREGQTVTVADCREALENDAVSLQITGGDMGNSGVLRAAMESKRFGALRVEEYVDVLKPEVPLQFAAVTFSDGGDVNFLAFRGTDETIAGWEEDFMIAFTETEAQKMALDYAARVLRPGRRSRMGGHSKGGNLALYAACLLPEEAWERLDRVYILDGPGLCPEVMDTSNLGRVDQKAVRIVPAFDVVGKLFEPKITDTRIVRSSQSGILQHSLATWGVEYGELARAEEHDRRSVVLMNVLNRWIESLSQEERRTLVRDLFGSLAAGGAVSLSDVAGGGPEGFEAVLMRMFHASDTTKRIMKDLPAQAVSALRERLRPAGD